MQDGRAAALLPEGEISNSKEIKCKGGLMRGAAPEGGGNGVMDGKPGRVH